MIGVFLLIYWGLSGLQTRLIESIFSWQGQIIINEKFPRFSFFYFFFNERKYFLWYVYHGTSWKSGSLSAMSSRTDCTESGMMSPFSLAQSQQTPKKMKNNDVLIGGISSLKITVYLQKVKTAFLSGSPCFHSGWGIWVHVHLLDDIFQQDLEI